MAKKYLDDAGLTYFWGKVRTYFLGGTSPDDPADTTNCPKMDGSKTYGTSHILAREDHVHPTDTSRAPLASPAFTGNPTAPTQSTSDDSTKIATTAFVHDLVDGIDVDVDDFTGATSSAAGAHGLVPAPASGDNKKVLVGDGNWRLLYLTCGSHADGGMILGLVYDQGQGTTISINTTRLWPATSSVDGAMSAEDKAKLDSITLTNNVIDSSCLPSYVDDVIEAYPRTGQTELTTNWLSLSSGGSALTPETGKIYVLLGNSTNYSTNDTFRWSGSTYVKLADGGVSSITTSEIDTIMAS